MSAALAIVLAFICLAGGALLGFLVGRGGGGDKKRAATLEREFEDYKRDVTAHFGKTAEHFQSMGRQYRELYEHMASGATTLCEQDDRTRLAFPSLLTIEAVAEPTEQAGPGPALDTESAQPGAEAAAETLESAGEQAAGESHVEPAADRQEDDAVNAEGAGDAADTDTDHVSASDEDEEALKVEVSVEVVDDDETGTEGAVIGASPRKDAPDLDPADDAGATRH